MIPDLETVAIFIGAIAAVASVTVVLFKWAEEQENAKHEQRRRELRNEIRAEIYRELLELNVHWLSGSATQRNLLSRLSDTSDDIELEDMPETESAEAAPRSP